MPVPAEDEVLIKVAYVGICGSDVHGFECGPFIPPKDPSQKIGLGHEFSGTVVSVGAGLKKATVYSVNREFHAGNVSTVLEDIITFVPRWTSWQPSLTTKVPLPII